MAGRIRRRLHLNNIYAFTCRKSTFQEDHSQIGGPGFSRVVYCNEPNSPAAERRSYAGNYVRSTKYTPASFVPKSLFEQFRRVANFYFLVTGILSLTPLSPYGAGNELMRLLNIAAFAVSGYASTEGRQCKPFNPLLGETYEADYPDKGLRFFSEKASQPTHLSPLLLQDLY
ncbi:hypothetical protein F2Q70_00019784 [Brassica cretica]|uniref:P-type ATPase N-terminal domain-containing protein n=1 Tax=Brassica cretica TaxID=69181 RepID=A0A8S9GIX0_BRACR|nr:hypothetical protein F2Q70_00019784 [Brassica cretica]